MLVLLDRASPTSSYPCTSVDLGTASFAGRALGLSRCPYGDLGPVEHWSDWVCWPRGTKRRRSSLTEFAETYDTIELWFRARPKTSCNSSGYSLTSPTVLRWRTSSGRAAMALWRRSDEAVRRATLTRLIVTIAIVSNPPVDVALGPSGDAFYVGRVTGNTSRTYARSMSRNAPP